MGHSCLQLTQEKGPHSWLEWLQQDKSLGGINNKHLSLIVLEGERCKIKVPTDLKSGENPLPGLQMATFFLCPHMTERKVIFLVPLFVRALTHSRGLHFQELITSQRSHLQIPSHWGLGLQRQNLGEHKHLVYSIC